MAVEASIKRCHVESGVLGSWPACLRPAPGGASHSFMRPMSPCTSSLADASLVFQWHVPAKVLLCRHTAHCLSSGLVVVLFFCSEDSIFLWVIKEVESSGEKPGWRQTRSRGVGQPQGRLRSLGAGSDPAGSGRPVPACSRLQRAPERT